MLSLAMTDTNIIEKIRHNIAEVKGNEAKALNESPSLSDLFSQRQQLLSEMHLSCKNAVEQAKAPFLSRLAEIEKEYAMMLQLIGDNKEK